MGYRKCTLEPETRCAFWSLERPSYSREPYDSTGAAIPCAPGLATYDKYTVIYRGDPKYLNQVSPCLFLSFPVLPTDPPSRVLESTGVVQGGLKAVRYDLAIYSAFVEIPPLWSSSSIRSARLFITPSVHLEYWYLHV